MLSRGGFVSHFGTSDANKVHQMVEAGDPKGLVWNTMIYQICKESGNEHRTSGKVDGIVLTGGLVRFDDIVEASAAGVAGLRQSLFTREMEQEEMAGAVLRVLRGEEEAYPYTREPVWKGFDF